MCVSLFFHYFWPMSRVGVMFRGWTSAHGSRPPRTQGVALRALDVPWLCDAATALDLRGRKLEAKRVTPKAQSVRNTGHPATCSVSATKILSTLQKAVVGTRAWLVCLFVRVPVEGAVKRSKRNHTLSYSVHFRQARGYRLYRLLERVIQLGGFPTATLCFASFGDVILPTQDGQPGVFVG